MYSSGMPIYSAHSTPLYSMQLALPTDKGISPQELLTGVALIEIKSELELRSTTKLLKIARKIARSM